MKNWTILFCLLASATVACAGEWADDNTHSAALGEDSTLMCEDLILDNLSRACDTVNAVTHPNYVLPSFLWRRPTCSPGCSRLRRSSGRDRRRK